MASGSVSQTLGPGDVVNNLTSTATDKPGSANMLKTLNDSIDELKNSFDVLSVNASITIDRVIAVGRIGWAGKEMRFSCPNFFRILKATGRYSITASKIYMGTTSSPLSFNDVTSKLTSIEISGTGAGSINFSSAPDGTSDHFALFELDTVVITRTA